MKTRRFVFLSRALLAVAGAMALAHCGADATVAPLADASANDGSLSDGAPADAGPVVLPELVAGQTKYSCVLKADRTVACWGDNVQGQLGNGGGPATNVPADVANLSNVSALTAGEAHACVIVAGEVFCWGSNLYNQLGGDGGTFIGEGGVLAAYTPTRVPGVSNAVAIAAGASHTCAILGDGTVRCWGKCNGNEGCLGDGTLTFTGTTDVVGLTNVKALSAGLNNTCALTTAGAVLCWGRNALGELGNGQTGGANGTPAPVVGLSSGVVAIASGYEHVCALLEDGTVKCWGEGSRGLLGNGAQLLSNTPVAVAGLKNVVQLRLSAISSCAVTADHVAYCWGDNVSDSLGTGSPFGAQPTALPVSVLTDPIAAIVPGGLSTCAVLMTGGIRCWGSGSLGDGVTTMSATPVTVLGFP